MAIGVDDAILWGSIISAGASMANTGVQAATAVPPAGTTHQAKLGLKYGKLYDTWAAQNMPSLNREGMEKAGFNPILAFSQGQSAHGMPSFSGTQAYSTIGNADFGTPIADAVNNYFNWQSAKNQLDLQQSQIQNTDSQTKLNDARTAETLDRIDTPRSMFQSINKGLKNAAQFFFGGSSAEKRSLWNDVKGFVKGRAHYIGANNGLVPFDAGEIFPRHLIPPKTVEVNGVLSVPFKGNYYLLDPNTRKIIDVVPAHK